MLKSTQSNRRIDTVFVLMVFCVFAVSVFLVLITAADVYRGTQDIAAHGQNERIALSYIRTKIRNADTAGAVFVDYFDHVPALHLQERIQDRTFATLIYHYDGWLHELFFETHLDFAPSDGIRLLRLDYLRFEPAEHGMIRVVTPYDYLLIYPRSTQPTNGGALN